MSRAWYLATSAFWWGLLFAIPVGVAVNLGVPPFGHWGNPAILAALGAGALTGLSVE